MNATSKSLSIVKFLAVYAHLVADALGVAYEFKPAHLIPARHLIEFEPPRGFVRAHASAPFGAYSDDGAQFLLLLTSLVMSGKLDLDDFGRGLVHWLDVGHMAVRNKVFDVGITTREAINRMRKGTPAAFAGLTEERANGNGSLMRVLAVTLWHSGPDEDLVKDAMRSSLPTHAHPRAVVCCGVYALWARYILEGRYATTDEAFSEALQFMKIPGILEEQEQFKEVLGLEGVMLDERSGEYAPRGTGYVVDSLFAAVRLNRLHETYEDVVKEAIALGNDTDTTACIAGPIAVLRGSDVPDRWLNALAQFPIEATRATTCFLTPEIIDDLREHLAKRAGR